jgi:transposase
MSMEGMGPSLAVQGTTTATVFETYLEKVLTPSLRPRQLVVMDNLSAHKGARVGQLIEERGCKLLYLPPYSPDLSPIEEAFSKIKGILRKVQASSRETLWWKRWAGRSTRSRPGTRKAFSSTADTGY